MSHNEFNDHKLRKFSMATFFDIQPQANVERNSSKFVLIILTNPLSKSESPRKTKSGLVKISNSRQWHQLQRTVKNDLQSLTTVYSRSNGNSNDVQFRMSKTSIELDDVEECSQQIQNYAKSHVYLILLGEHAQNRQLIARFKKLPQVAQVIPNVYACSQQRSQRHRFYQNKSFLPKILPKQLYTTSIEDFDEPMKLLLIEIFLEDFFVKLERSGEAKQDFIKYCQTVYHNKPNRLTQLEAFDRGYDKRATIHWYTRSDSCIFRIVSQVCASLDIPGSFDIRLILCDLYEQLKQLYGEQLEELKKTDLVVYRGIIMTRHALDAFKNIGEYCVTRPFVSTTTCESVARSFFGDCSVSEEEVSVMITMKIDSKQIKDSLLARIDHVSANPAEKEVMFFRNPVFRIESYDEIKDGPTYWVHIQLVRGEKEVEIESILRKKYVLLTAGAASPVLGLLGLLKLIDHHQHVGGQAGQIPRSLQLRNPQTNEQFSSAANIDNQPVVEFHNLQKIENSPCHTDLELGENLMQENQLLTNANAQPSGGIASNPATQIALTAKIAAFISNMSTPMLIGLITVVAFIVVTTAIGVPLGILLSPHSNVTGRDATTSCRTSCTFLPSVQNPSLNYQVEHLNVNCSQTLTNMTIIQKVQRNYNETYAQQYQTFWNLSTNMTYIVNPSEIIYQWFSLPGMYIVQNSFPHFIEVQFYYTSGSSRVTSNDTWAMSATSICGEQLNFSGTF